MDGYELARAIRRHERQTAAQRTPIVALTANVMEGEPDKCAAAGMDDFTAKPATIPVLAAKLHRWLPKLDWRAEPVRAGDENGAGLDGAVLDELTGGDPALTASVLSDFIGTSREDLRALADAAATHDHEQLRRQAPRIAGAGRIVGAGELTALAKQIENAAALQSGDWAGIRSLVDRLDAALATIAETIPAYREVLAPAGIPFELRAAFVVRGRCWGAVHIARREHKRDFTAEEADVLARLTGVIADGIRTSVRFDAARRAQDRTAPDSSSSARRTRSS